MPARRETLRGPHGGLTSDISAKVVAIVLWNSFGARLAVVLSNG